MASPAAVVSVEQSLTFQNVAAFGTFSQGSYVAGGWSAAYPFTNAAQITGISFLFSTTDADFNDSALFPAQDGGGVPSLEIGVLREDGPGRMALASVNAAAPGFSLNLSLADALLVRDWLVDGAMIGSIGAFTNFGNAAVPYSEALFLDAPSTLLVTVTGEVPDRNSVPEPGSLALAGFALAALAGRHRRAGNLRRAAL
jgi:hypothetical protein